jgi:uncharacterized membrane protein
MCSDNPDLPKEANKAKCFAISCFVFSIFSLVGFMGRIPGVVGAIGGLLACIASSMLMCCAPKKVEEGPCKFTAAGVMLLIAGILQLIMTVVVVVFMIMVLTEVNEDGYCADRYKSCNTDSNGCSCTDGTSSWAEDYAYYCSASTDGLCYDNSVDNPSDTSTMCITRDSKNTCEAIHGTAKDVVSAIVVIFFGLSAAFLLIAGILNTIGGAYCLKAKAAIQKAAVANAPAKV